MATKNLNFSHSYLDFTETLITVEVCLIQRKIILFLKSKAFVSYARVCYLIYQIINFVVYLTEEMSRIIIRITLYEAYYETALVHEIVPTCIIRLHIAISSFQAFLISSQFSQNVKMFKCTTLFYV